MRAALFIVVALVGCSQDPPPVLARAEGGNLVFDIPSNGKQERDCITRVAVFVEDSGYLAIPETGDDHLAVEAGDYWRAVGEGKDKCVGSLPVRYGRGIRGSTIVKPKPLRVGAAYTVAFAESSTGNRMGRFRILPDKRVENLSNAQGMMPDAR